MKTNKHTSSRRKRIVGKRNFYSNRPHYYYYYPITQKFNWIILFIHYIFIIQQRNGFWRSFSASIVFHGMCAYHFESPFKWMWLLVIFYAVERKGWTLLTNLSNLLGSKRLENYSIEVSWKIVSWYIVEKHLKKKQHDR